jgi:hypothetical protein
MTLRPDIQGLSSGGDLAGRVDEQRLYQFAFRPAAKMDERERREFDRLVRSWFNVAFHSGFGRSLDQLGDLEFGRGDGGELVTFDVVGALEEAALNTLLRCVEDTDLDVPPFDSLVIRVSAYR